MNREISARVGSGDSAMAGRPRLRFSAEDVSLFRSASGDFNPMHCESDFARRTAYGQPVVFGMLGVLAGLGHLRPRQGMVLKNLVVDFQGPLFTDIDYRISATEDSEGSSSFRIADGRRRLCGARMQFQPPSESKPPSDVSPRGPSMIRESPQDWLDDALRAGLRVEHDYSPDPVSVEEVEARFALKGKGASSFQVGVLLWASYVVGMEIPGRRAMFSRLALSFDDRQPTEVRPFSCAVSVRSFDDRFGLVELEASVAVGDTAVARGALQAFVIRPVRKEPKGNLLLTVRIEPRLAGRTAAVIGGSRGLGGALAQALTLAGCTTYATYLDSQEHAERLRDELPGPVRARFRPVRGDASSPNDCRALRSLVMREHSTLDVLICSATPPLLPLWLEEDSLDRLGSNLQRAIALSMVPLATLLCCITPDTGWVVAISSAAVEDPVADWPHYVAAKRAIEGLIDVAAREYPRLRFLVVRPPRLLTDLTNTPLGRDQALLPEDAALRVIERVTTDECRPGQVRVLSEFGAREGER